MTRWPSVDRSPTPTGWARPGNLMPAVGPSSWPRGRRAMTESEEILATAEAWWDVDRSNFRDGDRYLRNIGTAGSVLDLRLGSSGVANSNDPKWLGPEGTGYVYLPGVAGNCLQVTSSASFNVVNVDARVRVAMDNWIPTANSALMGRWNGAGTYSWRLLMDTAGKPWFFWSNDGTTQLNELSTAATGFAAGTAQWLRVTMTVDNGAGKYEVAFYTAPDSPDEPSSWTQLGTTKTGAATTSVYSVASVDINVGAVTNGTNNPATARTYRSLLKSGINGTTVLDIDADAITSGAATSFTATTGQTVTINRATSGRKSVAMPSRAKGGRPCMLLGTDDYLECQDAAQHGLLNFGQGDSFTVLAVVRQWGTPANNGRYLDKRGFAGLSGYFLCTYTTVLRLYPFLSDGPNISQDITNGKAMVSGQLSMITSVVNRLTKSMAQGVNDSNGPAVSLSGLGSAVSSFNFNVGRAASGSVQGVQDFEFRAAAVFRRALTAREITVIANAAPWGI